MKNITTALFDFDGTLFDSMYIWETVGVSYLKSKGCVVDEDIHEQIKKFTLFEAACYFKQRFKLELTPEQIVGEINQIIAKAYFEEVQPKPHVVELVELLSSWGVKLYVATATDSFLIDGALKRAGLRDYFIDIFSCSDVGCSKNHVEFFKLIDDKVHFDKSTTWLFDDAAHACAVAKEYGLKVCGVKEKTEIEQEKVRSNSDVYISDFSEVLNLFK